MVNTLKCFECRGHCNKKGYPSVMKNSAYCQTQRGVLTKKQIGIWKRFKTKLYEKTIKNIKIKGFR